MRLTDLCGFVAAVLLLASDAPSQTTSPAPSSAPGQANPSRVGAGELTVDQQVKVAAATHALAQAVEVLVKQLDHQQYARRVAAQKMLVELGQGYFEEMLARIQPGGDSQGIQGSRIFTTLAASARGARMLASVSDGERPAVEKLAGAHPEAFRDLFGPSPAAAARAVKLLTPRGSPGSETIALWALKSPLAPVRLAVLRQMSLMPNLSSGASHALLAHMEELYRKKDRFGDAAFDWAMMRSISQEIEVACQALGNSKDPAALPHLLRALLDGREWGTESAQIARIIMTFNDKRIVPTLMDRMKKDNITEGWGVTITAGEKTIMQRPIDLAMRIVVQQTGQSAKSYGFADQGEEGPSKDFIGFAEDEHRQAARRKLLQWWKGHERDYAGVETFTSSEQLAVQGAD